MLCPSGTKFKHAYCHYGSPLQNSCLENPMDGGAWWAAVRGVAKSQAGLSDFTFAFHFHALEKAMAPHSSVLAWRIAGRGSLVAAVSGVTQSDTTDATQQQQRQLCHYKDSTALIFELLFYNKAQCGCVCVRRWHSFFTL